jgi:hypothetical protein
LKYSIISLEKTTIRDAFRHAGMWSPNLKIVEQDTAKNVNPVTTPAGIAETLTVPDPQTPNTATQAERKLEKRGKVEDMLSSPTRVELESFQRGTMNPLDESELCRFEDSPYQKLESHPKLTAQ